MSKTIKVLVFILISLSLESCLITGVVGSRNVTTENRNLDEAFSNVSVSQGIQVYYTQGETVSCSAEMDDNLHEILKTKIENGTLKIYFSKNVSKRKSSKVYLSAPSLEKINSSSGSRFETINTLKINKLELDSSSGSSIIVRVQTDELKASSSSGSSINIEGDSKRTWAEASSGSSISGEKLKTFYGEIDASSGASVELTVLKKLDAEASSGASINILGGTEETTIQKSSGGSINIH